MDERYPRLIVLVTRDRCEVISLPAAVIDDSASSRVLLAGFFKFDDGHATSADACDLLDSEVSSFWDNDADSQRYVDSPASAATEERWQWP